MLIKIILNDQTGQLQSVSEEYDEGRKIAILVQRGMRVMELDDEQMAPLLKWKRDPQNIHKPWEMVIAQELKLHRTLDTFAHRMTKAAKQFALKILDNLPSPVSRLINQTVDTSKLHTDN